MSESNPNSPFQDSTNLPSNSEQVYVEHADATDVEACRSNIARARSERWSNQSIVRAIGDADDDGNPKTYRSLLHRARLVEKFNVFKLCGICRCVYSEGDAAVGALCGNVLMENGKRKHCKNPLKNSLTMPYRPISTWLEDKIREHGGQKFKEMCNEWRSRETKPGYTSDWFDGERFKEEEEWLTSPLYDLSLGLLMNIDWWQPFQRTIHSMGGIYSSVLNLSREKRQKLENIFTIAVIPGPKEPKTDQMNFILRPLVDELKMLHDGVIIDGMKVRAKVVFWSCDLPALRKSLGFLAHNANKGCSKCLLPLRQDGVDTLAVGEPRSNEHHREIGIRLAQMVRRGAKTQKENLERDTGVRISVLNELPYHRPVTDHVVEPMHNLLMGVTKRVFSTLVEKGILDHAKLADRLEGVVSSGIVARVRCNFAWFTAHDWLELLTSGSLYGLIPLVSQDILRMMEQLRDAIVIFLARTVKLSDLDRADVLLKLALRRYLQLDSSTPNAHFAFHISQDIKNFGPAPVYWAFSFERKNGVDGKLTTSGRSDGIACEVMKKIDIGAQVCSTKTETVKKSYTGKPKHMKAATLNLDNLLKAINEPITKVESVGQAVTEWKERIKRGDVIFTSSTDHYKVTNILLVNGMEVVIEGHKFQGRILSDEELVRSGPCYRALEEQTMYVLLREFQGRCRHVLERDGRVHVLLPERKKQCF